jgi:hypothetical protein
LKRKVANLLCPKLCSKRPDHLPGYIQEPVINLLSHAQTTMA